MLSNLRDLIKELFSEVRAESREPQGLRATRAKGCISILRLEGVRRTEMLRREAASALVGGKAPPEERTIYLVSLSSPFPV